MGSFHRKDVFAGVSLNYTNMKKLLLIALFLSPLAKPSYVGDKLTEIKISLLKHSRIPYSVSHTDNSSRLDSVIVVTGQIAHYPNLKFAKIVEIEAGAILYAPKLAAPDILRIGDGSAIHMNGNYSGDNAQVESYLLSWENVGKVLGLIVVIFGIKIAGSSKIRPYRY